MNVRMLALALVGVAGLGAGACVDSSSDSGLRIIGNVAADDGCVVDGASTKFLDSGFIDANSVVGYKFTPAVINDLITSAEGQDAAKTIYVTHARVDIAFYDPDFQNLSVDAGLLEFQVG